MPGKGGRAWYVDTASGWVATRGGQSVFRRELPRDHPLRQELVSLADANGNVNSGVGWHARKMEVCPNSISAKQPTELTGPAHRSCTEMECSAERTDSTAPFHSHTRVNDDNELFSSSSSRLFASFFGTSCRTDLSRLPKRGKTKSNNGLSPRSISCACCSDLPRVITTGWT